jgi:hypothetical protein
MEPSPSCEANRRPAAQEIPSVLRNLRVHFHANKSPPLVPIPRRFPERCVLLDSKGF